MESRLIHNILDSVPGVLSVDVMVVTKMVAVQHEPAAISPAALVAALNSAGLQASLNKHSTSGGSEPAAAATSRPGMCSSGCCGEGQAMSSSWQRQPSQQRRGLYWLLAVLRGHPALPPVCVLLSALLLVVNLLLLLPGAGVAHLLQKGLLALVAAAIAVPPVLKKAWNGLKNKNLDMNSLVSSSSPSLHVCRVSTSLGLISC
jgi:cation transport ATPase